MKVINRIKRYWIEKSEKPAIIGVTHSLGQNGETPNLDDTVEFLEGLVNEGDKVMLEGYDYPLSTSFREHVSNDRVAQYMERLARYLEEKRCEIIMGEDENLPFKDSRRNEVFVEKILTNNPRFFIVGAAHLDSIKAKLPRHVFIYLPSYKSIKETRRLYEITS